MPTKPHDKKKLTKYENKAVISKKCVEFKATLQIITCQRFVINKTKQLNKPLNFSSSFRLNDPQREFNT